MEEMEVKNSTAPSMGWGSLNAQLHGATKPGKLAERETPDLARKTGEAEERMKVPEEVGLSILIQSTYTKTR